MILYARPDNEFDARHYGNAGDEWLALFEPRGTTSEVHFPSSEGWTRVQSTDGSGYRYTQPGVTHTAATHTGAGPNQLQPRTDSTPTHNVTRTPIYRSPGGNRHRATPEGRTPDDDDTQRQQDQERQEREREAEERRQEADDRQREAEQRRQEAEERRQEADARRQEAAAAKAALEAAEQSAAKAAAEDEAAAQQELEAARERADAAQRAADAADTATREADTAAQIAQMEAYQARGDAERAEVAFAQFETAEERGDTLTEQGRAEDGETLKKKARLNAAIADAISRARKGERGTVLRGEGHEQVMVQADGTIAVHNAAGDLTVLNSDGQLLRQYDRQGQLTAEAEPSERSERTEPAEQTGIDRMPQDAVLTYDDGTTITVSEYQRQVQERYADVFGEDALEDGTLTTERMADELGIKTAERQRQAVRQQVDLLESQGIDTSEMTDEQIAALAPDVGASAQRQYNRDVADFLAAQGYDVAEMTDEEIAALTPGVVDAAQNQEERRRDEYERQVLALATERLGNEAIESADGDVETLAQMLGQDAVLQHLDYVRRTSDLVEDAGIDADTEGMTRAEIADEFGQQAIDAVEADNARQQRGMAAFVEQSGIDAYTEGMTRAEIAQGFCPHSAGYLSPGGLESIGLPRLPPRPRLPCPRVHQHARRQRQTLRAAHRQRCQGRAGAASCQLVAQVANFALGSIQPLPQVSYLLVGRVQLISLVLSPGSRRIPAVLAPGIFSHPIFTTALNAQPGGAPAVPVLPHSDFWALRHPCHSQKRLGLRPEWPLLGPLPRRGPHSPPLRGLPPSPLPPPWPGWRFVAHSTQPSAHPRCRPVSSTAASPRHTEFRAAFAAPRTAWICPFSSPYLHSFVVGP